MEISTFEEQLDEESAIERTRNLSLNDFVRAWIDGRLGRERDRPAHAVEVVYYPDYIAYTTATIRRTLRGRTELKFLAGVDAVTSRPGEVDVALPSRRTIDADPDLVIDPQIDEDEAERIWREWLFRYVGRYHRAAEMPDYSLDNLELVYTPYWIIDRGTTAESLAVSDLTGRTARVEEIEVIEEFYTHHM
jgi:hypothetical protein